MRGTNWRGKDCDDFNHNVHPGARPVNSDVEVDSNCNGIFVSLAINLKTSVSTDVPDGRLMTLHCLMTGAVDMFLSNISISLVSLL